MILLILGLTIFGCYIFYHIGKSKREIEEEKKKNV